MSLKEDEKRLKEEIARLLADAETTDAAEDEAHGRDRSGDEIPDKLKRRESRMAKILEAKALLEERARADTAEEAAHRQTEGDQGIDVGLSAIAPETGRLEEGTQELQHAIAVAQKLDPAYSKRHRISQDVAAAFMVIGEATLWTNRPAGAARAYQSAADFLVTALPAQRHSLADHLDSGHSALKTPVQVQVLSSVLSSRGSLHASTKDFLTFKHHFFRIHGCRASQQPCVPAQARSQGAVSGQLACGDFL
jgi:hypothetical protein